MGVRDPVWLGDLDCDPVCCCVEEIDCVALRDCVWLLVIDGDCVALGVKDAVLDCVKLGVKV